MKRFVLVLIATASLAVMAAQAGNNPLSSSRLPVRQAGSFSASNPETASQHVLNGEMAAPTLGKGTAARGIFFAKELNGGESLTEGAKTDTVLNEEEEEEEGEEGEDEEEGGDEEEEEGEGWDRTWDAPKLA